MAELYSILLEEDVPVDPRKYGAIVAPALGLTALEAKIAVKKGRGIFLENIAGEHAHRIVAELEKDAIRARVFSREQIPPLPAPAKVLHLEHGEEVLGYRLAGSDERASLVWDGLTVVSCGVVAKPEFEKSFTQPGLKLLPAFNKLEAGEREIVRENLILKLSAPAAAEPEDARKEDSDAVFERIDAKYGSKVKVYCDLVTADLSTWLRVPLAEMAYAYMADSVKMGGSWGFQMLMNDLQKKCAGALTEMTLKLLKAADITELVFAQIEVFTRLTAWASLKRHLWLNADSSSPSPEAPGSSTDAGSSNASPGPGPSSTSS